MEIARLLEIKANNKDEDFRELVRRHLELKGNGKWFLVVDIVDDESFLYGQSSFNFNLNVISEASLKQIY